LTLPGFVATLPAALSQVAECSHSDFATLPSALVGLRLWIPVHIGVLIIRSTFIHTKRRWVQSQTDPVFADMSPDVRAAWFSHVLHALPGTGKQYVAALNTENYEAMLPYLSQEDREALDNARVLILRGDKEENKLLGIQFGK
jgi:hypothetical protein